MVREARAWAALTLAAVMLIGCAPRGSIRIDPAAAEVGAVETVLVASSRVPQSDGPGFGAGISRTLGFAEFRISVPPDRALGTVAFGAPNRKPNPATDFLTVSAQRIGDEAAFLRKVNAEVASLPGGSRDVFVFVHGFNTNFAEGLYRQAQMTHDFKSPGISINYAWPSAGRVTAYATDREAALVARDGLQELLQLLARSKADRIIVMGHSMGAMVVMEAMRQVALENDRAVIAKTDAIVLMAADLDIEVFRRQMQPIAARKMDVIVFTSSRDRALGLSARLRGSSERLGGIPDDRPVADLPVTVIDLSSFRGEEDALSHFTAATSPALISLFAGMGAVGLDILRDQPASVGLIEAGLGIVGETAYAITDPLTTR
jgi:esterase/lipase superfamily enzyme